MILGVVAAQCSHDAPQANRPTERGPWAGLANAGRRHMPAGRSSPGRHNSLPTKEKRQGRRSCAGFEKFLPITCLCPIAML